MLAEAEARLREGEALTHVGRWQWDVATNAVQWSDEYHRIHGVDPLDFDGTFDAHLACIHEDDRPRVRAAVERSITTGRAAQEEYRIVRPDGEIRSVHTRAEPTIDSTGAVVGLRGVGQDITEDRRSQCIAVLRVHAGDVASASEMPVGRSDRVLVAGVGAARLLAVVLGDLFATARRAGADALG